MRTYKDFAINTKLSLLALLAGGAALLLSTIGFVWNDVSMIRRSMIKQMSTVAELLGANSTAALNFQDADTANELLSSLRRQPAVAFACIYDAAGRPFATYRRKGVDFTPKTIPKVLGSYFVDGGYLDVLQSIEHDGQTIGKIYLHVSIDELRHQFLRYVAIMAVVIVLSLGSSLLLSSRLQRIISVPILKLAEAVQEISRGGDYGIRVKKIAKDEIGTLYDQFNAMLEQIELGEATIQQDRDQLEVKVEQRTAELSRANKDLSREIAVREHAEQELEATHQKLMVAARRAGMAEIATGVLHNVGNVLNSINVSATLVSDRMRQSKVADLLRATELMSQHSQDLGAFITSDPKGKQLPGFLSLLAIHLGDERRDVADELDLLNTKIAHVKAIVATQQSYAGVSGIIEAVDLATTLDDATKLDTASFERHKITIVKEYQDLPKIRIDKQKVLQILVNLIKNAKEAFEGSPTQGRTLTVRTSLSHGNMVRIEIIDNGMGIPVKDLTRIFSHGFTTKKTGHGFGLHSCANAANEMRGSLIAQSDGPGQGAMFVLEIPYEPATVPLPI